MSNSDTIGNSSGITRRSFIRQVGIAGVAVSSAKLLAETPEREPAKVENPPSPPPKFVPTEARAVTLNVNGKEHKLMLEARVTLLDCLRENLNLPGTKKGCDHGQCGACTVHVNGKRVNACLSFAMMHEGDKITTIEGLGTPEKMHPVQKAFVECDAYQCGYCTPGQIMSVAALLKEPGGKSDQELRDSMSGNICRCGAYKNILAAIKQVRG